jgi:hypothetical protein
MGARSATLTRMRSRINSRDASIPGSPSPARTWTCCSARPTTRRAILQVLNDSGVGTVGGVPKLVDVDQAPNNAGKTSADHFVRVKNGEIYDPWPCGDGKQVIPAGSAAAKRYEQSFVE